MELIIQQSNKFKTKVVNFFKTTYHLSEAKELLKMSPKKYFLLKNNLVIHNSILNKHYKTDFSNNNYTIIHILYKNLTYNDTFCYTDYSIKNNCSLAFNELSKKIPISNKIQILGRKYKDKHDLVNNSLEKYVYINIKNFKKQKDNKKKENIVKEEVPDKEIKKRFMENLQQDFENNNIKFSRETLNNAIYIDTEYTTDIYDNLQSFPISNDTSILFMIGIFHNNEFIHFTANNLSHDEERRIVKEFLEYIKKNSCVLLHWSHAEKTMFNKMKNKYSDLFLDINLIFIDLLLITKNSIKLQKYSLKYTLSKLLNINYDTDCKNGSDAMMTIIQSNIYLKKNESLINIDTTKDIIRYNKLDTESLYKLVRFFNDHL